VKTHIGNDIYYLYTENYVPGLDYIKSVYDSYLKNNKWDFVSPIFELASTVKQATIYQKTEDADEITEYAVDSGHDFVFLAKSFEDVNNA
jgi:hypothetical protein